MVFTKPYLTDMVGTTVHYTRALHAQLSFNTDFVAPSVLHRSTAAVLAITGSHVLVKRSLDLGARLICGFELMYQLSRAVLESQSHSRVNSATELQQKKDSIKS